MQDPTGEAASVAQKHLTFYEMDLGLNNVVRKWTEPIDNGANLLVAVPGGADGPGGVLVCAENFIIYKNQVRPFRLMRAAANRERGRGRGSPWRGVDAVPLACPQDHEEVRAVIPRRSDLPGGLWQGMP